MCMNFFPGISGGVLTPLTPPPLGSATDYEIILPHNHINNQMRKSITLFRCT